MESSYLLLFKNSGAENYRHLDLAEPQHLIANWNTWYDGLIAQGKTTEAQPLEDTKRVLVNAGGSRVVDGPFAEAKEAIGGYVKFAVDSYDEAAEIAHTHPGLAFGMLIEIRRMAGNCHLGITHDGARGPVAASRCGAPARPKNNFSVTSICKN
jgi:hypothetical protein